MAFLKSNRYEKITFAEKNDLIVKHKGSNSFDRDLELLKKHCPAHSLLKELARANSFSFARLDDQMLGVLLDVVTIDEILENRTKELEKPIEPKTIEEIKQLLINVLGLDEKDLEALSEIIPLWITKSDDEILSAVKKLLGEDNPSEENTNTDNAEAPKLDEPTLIVEKVELPKDSSIDSQSRNH